MKTQNQKQINSKILTFKNNKMILNKETIKYNYKK